MSIPLPFANNNIQLYAYEGFDYVISNPNLSFTLQTVSNSTGLNPTSLYFTKNGNTSYRFSVQDLSMNLTAGTTEFFLLSTVSGTIVSNSSNTVFVNPGRFLDESGVTLSNRSFTFFKNEAIERIRLVAPSFSLKQPTSIPSLPPGLSFVSVASNIYDISGIPLVTVPNSNYQIIGVQNGGNKVITTRINMAISGERVRLFLTDSSVNDMIVGTPITPRTLTAIPPLGTTALRYTFPTFPDGITVTDNSGNLQSSPFFPTDPAYTLVLSGTPTLAAANAFRVAEADSNGFPYTIRSARTAPLPLIENSQSIQFAFDETVLFDLSSIQPLYTGVPLVPGQNFFRAETYFTSNVGISSIFSPDLRADLSLVFFPGTGFADLSGTPSAPGSASFTIRAINSNGTLRDYVTPITVVDDSVSFSSPTDVSYAFVLSRPIAPAFPGYYPSPIRFVATAASDLPVSLSAPALSGTGLSLDSNGFLTGLPSAIRPLTDLIVTATVSGSPATATKTVKFSILDDVFTIGNVSPSNFTFVENIPITPFQIPVTTLSGRNVIDYAQTGLPSGLSISPAGIVSGTPLDFLPLVGNVTITPTTGFSSGTRDFSYNLTPDSILFTVPQDSYVYQAGDALEIPVTGTSYSGTTVRNYTLTLPPSYGLTINSNTGLMLGTWTNSIPPNQILPASGSFTVTAQANTITGVLDASFTAFPVLQNTSFVWHDNKLFSYNDVSWNQTMSVSGAVSPFDIVIKNNNVDGNFILGTAGAFIVRSTNANDFRSITPDGTSSQLTSELAFKPGSTTWWVSGSDVDGLVRKASIKQSEDNGLTWPIQRFIVDVSSGLELVPRDNHSYPVTNPYIRGGVAFVYKSGVMMTGGLYDGVSSPVMLRSTNEGGTWKDVSGGFARETGYFNVDHSTLWVASGSSQYATKDAEVGAPYSTATDTLKYSSNQGLTWSNATGAFNMFGYELLYASNTWVATGVSVFEPNPVTKYYRPEIRYSTDGSNWTKISFLSDLFPQSNTNPSTFVAPLPLGSMNYDGSNWNVFVQRQDGSMNWVTEIYSSPTVNAASWSSVDITNQFQSPNNQTRRFVSYTRPQFLRPSSVRTITINLSFGTGIGNGPAITSPSLDSFLLYQYVPVSIEFAADDPNAYFFISDEELPPGLEFDPLTNIISGKPAQQGSFTTRIYAQTQAGVTLRIISFVVNIPRILRKQDGAGAYTSLLRQYTEVLAAQSARDSRALPTQLRQLGEFMSPVPEPVITAVLPRACLVCRRVECPTLDQRVDANGAETLICDFIDANSGDVFDAGNAEANVCD